MYDVDAIRKQFPALTEGAAHFDAPGGTQVPGTVAEAVAGAIQAAVANRGRVTAAEQRAERIVAAARESMADLLCVPVSGVVFGRSMTQLTYDFSRTLAKQWGTDDEIVVTRLDHDANIRPWVQVAEAVGATVRWVDFDRRTGELTVSAVVAELTERTRLVAVTGASNLLGTRPDIPSIADAAHGVGALVYVDGVHLTPHVPVDVPALGADFYACSPYKFYGPHLGVLAASPELLETLRPDKLLPSTDAVPERFELGTLPYELLAGTTAAVDFLASLTPGSGDRSTRLRASLTALEAHEMAMLRRLESGLDARGGITRFSNATSRTPLVLFTVSGHPPQEVHRHLGAAGVNAPAGAFYALECSRWLGLGDGGAVRAGFAAYTNTTDVDRLLDALDRL